MSLRPFTQITIEQIPTKLWEGRNSIFTLDFNSDYEVESSWETHTNNGSIKFPKNINLFGTPDGIFTYSNYFRLILGGSGATGQGTNIDTFGSPVLFAPLIMKGDKITINHGYIFRNGSDQDIFCSTGGLNIFDFQINKDSNLSFDGDLFTGYVSSVCSGTPIEIKVEDYFYLLKKTPFDKSVWNLKESGSSGTSLYALMQHILDLVNANFHTLYPETYPLLELLKIPNSITAEFSLGYLEIGDMTCAQLLDKLKQQYHFESTFRDNVLQFGFPIYTDSINGGVYSDSKTGTNLAANSNNFFCFRDIYNNQHQLQASANIFPSHDLKYINKDDVILSATVQCKVINSVPGKSTLFGKQKTKVEKLKVLVYWDIPTETFKYFDLTKPGTKVPLNPDGGERHQFYYPVDKSNPNPNISDLVKLGTEQLYKYHYTGFKGSFTTFGFPFVQWNDNVNILDPTYSDRNGQYKVKSVKYRGGLKGLSQEIELDYKLDIKLPDSVLSISML